MQYNKAQQVSFPLHMHDTYGYNNGKYVLDPLYIFFASNLSKKTIESINLSSTEPSLPLFWGHPVDRLFTVTAGQLLSTLVHSG